MIRLKRKNRIIASLLLATLTVPFVAANVAVADNVAQVQTTKFLAPETVNLMRQRIAAGSGGQLFNGGDVLSYIITFTPVAKGGNIGAGGYITDYIPPGTEVVGAEYVQPDGNGGYVTVSVGQQAYMPDGWGPRGIQVFGAPFAGYAQGSLAQVYADTGIFYSTDPRTAMYAGAVVPAANAMPIYQTPTPGVKATQYNGYSSQNGSPSGYLPAPSVVHNYWDAMMVYHLGTKNTVLGAKILANGRGNTPYGAGSAVAGPDTFYSLDYTGSIGPWQRVYYPGSMIGQGPPPVGPGDTTPVINGVPTSAGWHISPSTPLPSNTNAVRFSFGKLEVGQFNHVKISLRLLTAPPATGVQNNSEVSGGDAADIDAVNPGFVSGGQDSPWRYWEGSVADNNSGFYVLKEIVAVNGLPSSGQNVVLNDVIRYRITYINTGVQPMYVKFDDLLSQGLTYQAGSAMTLSGPNVFSTPPVFAASGTATFATIPPAPATPILLPMGGGGSFQLDAKVTVAPANPFVTNTVTANYGATAAALTNKQQSIAVSNFGTTSPPNIQQTKSASPNSIPPDSSTTYSITITNNGSTPADGVLASTITDTLPPGFTFVTGSTAFYNSGNLTYIPAPAVNNNASGQQVVTWTIPAGVLLASGGATWRINFNAVTDPNISPAVYYNDVSSHIYYTSAKGGTYIDTSTPQTAPVTVSAVRLTKMTTTPTIYMTNNGATAHYRVVLFNDNSSPLSSVNITDALPSGFSYASGTAYFAINGGASSPVAAGDIVTGANSVSFNNFTLVAASNLKVDFDVNIAASANVGLNNNTVSATGLLNGATPVTIPSFTGAPVNVLPQGLVVNKYVSDASGNAIATGQNGVIFAPATTPAIYTASQAAYYTIELINSGNTYMTNVGMNDVLPTGFVYQAAYNPLVLYRQLVNNVVTIASAPASLPVNDAAKTYTINPRWSTFSVPPQQAGVPSKILITFPVDVRMQATGGAAVDVLRSAGQYQNTAAADNANNVFTGAPIEVFEPLTKASVTKTVVASSQATYTITLANNTPTPYVANLTDTVKNVANATQNWPFVSDTLGALTGGATRPAVGAMGLLNWTNLTVPVGGLTFDFTVTVPAGTAAATYHNTASMSAAGGIGYTFDGTLASNTSDDVVVSLTPPATPPTLLKNTLNAAAVGGPFSIASSPAVVHNGLGGKIWYELVIQNNAAGILTLGNTVDTLPNRFTVVAADLANTAYKVVTRPRNSVSGTIAGANVAPLAPAAMTLAGQNLTIPTTGLTIPASSAAVPQGFEMAIIFRATVGAAATPVSLGQYSNTFTVNDPTAGNPPLGSYSGGLVEVAPIQAAKSIDPAMSTIMAGQSTRYTIEVTNSNPQPFTLATPLTVTDTLPASTTAGVVSTTPVTYSAIRSIYTWNPATGASAAATPATSPAAGATAPAWTFNPITIPGASNGAVGKLVIVFDASTSATAPDGTYLNKVTTSFTDPLPNGGAAAAVTDTMIGADLNISSLTVTKTASPATVLQTPTGVAANYVIRIENPSANPVTLFAQESLPFGFLFNTAAGASQSAASYYTVNRATLVQSASAAASVRDTSGLALAAGAAVSQFRIYQTAATVFTLPANTDLYINLDKVYIQPTLSNGVYYNNLSVRNAAGQVLRTLTNTAPVTLASPQLYINKTTTTPVLPKSSVNAGNAVVHYDISIENRGAASGSSVVLTDLLSRLNPPASATAVYPAVVPASVVISVTDNGVTTTLAPAGYSVNQPVASNAATFDTVPAGGFTVPAANGANSGWLRIGFDVSIPTTAEIGQYYNTVNGTTANAGTLSYASGAPFSITAFGLMKSVVAINGNTANTTSVSPGDVVEYQIISYNTGPNNLPNVNVTDVLPNGFTYVVGSATVNNSPIPPGAAIGAMEPVGTTTLVWSPIPIASNGAVALNFRALAGAGISPGTYYNNASINDGGSQTVASGNTAPVTMQLNPQMTILKAVTNLNGTPGNPGATAVPSDTLRYTLTILLSQADAKNIYVTDTLDPALNYIEGSEALSLPGGLTLNSINYYGRGPGYSFISSMGAVPASGSANANIGRVIYTLNGNMTPGQQFIINYSTQVQ